MWIKAITVILAVTIVSCMTACSSETNEKDMEIESQKRLVQALFAEKTEIENQLEIKNKQYETAEYERDAFLQENLDLRDQMKSLPDLQAEFDDYKENCGRMVTNYRNDVMDILGYLKENTDFPIFDSTIPETHVNLMKLYIGGAAEMIKDEISISLIPEPIFSVIYIGKLEGDEIHRPIEENISYYSVIFYQSLIPAAMYEGEGPARGPFDGLITHYLIEIEDLHGILRIRVFEPNV